METTLHGLDYLPAENITETCEFS